MRFHNSFAAMAVVVLTTLPLGAQTYQVPYERVLVPIYISRAVGSPLPGAYGSLWTTQLTIRNQSDSSVHVSDNPLGCGIPEGCSDHITPATTLVNPPYNSEPNRGLFLYVGSPGKGKVGITLRVQDVSRQSETWGTMIPVVDESDVYSDTLQLIDVPTAGGFRGALRVYDFDDPADRQVRLQIFPLESNTVLVDTTLTLPGQAEGHPFPSHPASVMIGDLALAFPALANTERVRINITPVTEGTRFWAFVTATNNETQHVTAITPR